MAEPSRVSDQNITEELGFRSRAWQLSYRSSSITKGEEPDDILHDFYIPALKLAVKYDRVAGYFRSSSLAAASQGFTSFVGRKGRMRLIVGADLDPEDVRAILAGDRERLERRLSERLESPEAWPDDVRRGVTLLAWMVAQGFLEVRIALRKHAVTGEPIPFDSDEDGYFHEKWFIMTDAAGNRLYGSGSLNESKTALKHNFENITLLWDWLSDDIAAEIDRVQRGFEAMWNNEMPHLAVLTLPEAVRKRLIRLAEGVEVPAEIDGTRPKLPSPAVPSALERLRFAVLRDAPRMPGGRLVGLTTAPVDAWPHQEVVVRRLVETWPYSYLLCDEVGLGKTIEAGLAFRCLYLSGIVKRILIAAPASLTEQWLRQVASKVLMPFGKAVASPQMQHEYLLPKPAKVPTTSLFAPDLVIISTGLLSRRERAEALRDAEPFDIVLLDEAHAARRSNATQGTAAFPEYVELYKNLRDLVRPRAQSLWLATATPMQLHPVEVCDLIALTRRVGPFQLSPRLTLEYYRILGNLVQGGEPSDAEWEFLRRSVNLLQYHDPFLWRYLRSHVVPPSLARPLDQWLEAGRIPHGKRDRETLRRVLFSAAPLSRVMMRHTRDLLNIYRAKGRLQQNLARRRILPLRSITFSEKERRLYEQLEEYCKGLSDRLSDTNGASGKMLQFYLSFLRLRFASSLYAIEQTLRRRLARVRATLSRQAVGDDARHDDEPAWETWFEDDFDEDVADTDLLLDGRKPADLRWEEEQLVSMLRELDQITERASKMQELLRILDQRRANGRIKQTVIFTRFYDTLQDILKNLLVVSPGIRVGTYSGRGAEYYNPELGRMCAVDREDVKALFLRGEIDVLLCTDAAAEGLNLQTADMLINFDLGWNPMKIEQRIGRIDRIGQRHAEIYVVNLCYADSVEETVYGRLLARLEQANLMVGTQQVSLLPVTPEDFRRLAEGSLSEEELAELAEARLREQNERAKTMQLSAEDLYDIYMRMASDPERPQAPVDRAAIWQALVESDYLRALGCRKAGGDDPVFIVHGVDGVPEGIALTCSPELYEMGLADGLHRLHFASYGDPAFDALLAHMTQYELPPCIRRIEVPSGPKEQFRMVAYAVACRAASGTVEVRLVKSWTDLDGLQLAEDTVIDDAAVEPLRNRLHQLALREYEPHLLAKQIEAENERSAFLQRLLELSVIKDHVLACSTRDGARETANSVLRLVEEMYTERETLLATVPAEPFRRRSDLLFEVHLWRLKDHAQVLVSPLLRQASLDAGRALVASMKRRSGSITVRAMVARLDREIEELWGWLAVG